MPGSASTWAWNSELAVPDRSASARMAKQSAASAQGIDQRALKILHASYWSVSGWKREGERQPSAEDFAYAKSKGMMFDPAPSGHAEVVSRLNAAVRQLDRRTVADAFLASLSTRRLELERVEYRGNSNDHS
jgi:hypothetical protein